MKVERLSVRYGKTEILKELTFELPPQTVTVLLGKNGSGKTTLLRALAGQLPCSGTLSLPKEPRERAKKLGYLPQFLPAVSLEAEQLVAMGRTPYHTLPDRLTLQDRQKIEEALMLAEAQDLRHRRVDTLSGGERQRVYLAMVLAQDTEYLLLDEPTAHVDMGYAAAFLQRLHTLTDHGKTVLAVLHDLNAAVTHADRLLLLERGALTDPARMEEVFGVQRIPYTENGETKYFYK